jgi:hypothetical protein
MNIAAPGQVAGQPGAFPRTEIAPDETVLFEGKPSMVATTFYGLMMLLGGVVLGAPLLVFGMVFLVCSSVLIIAGVLPFVYYYMIWSGTSFALTNKRVLLHKTTSSLQKSTSQLPLAYVTQTVRSQEFIDQLVGSGNIGFSAIPGYNGFMWPSVPNHDSVRPFIDQQIARYRPPVQQVVYAPPPPPQYYVPAYGQQRY